MAPLLVLLPALLLVLLPALLLVLLPALMLVLLPALMLVLLPVLLPVLPSTPGSPDSEEAARKLPQQRPGPKCCLLLLLGGRGWLLQLRLVLLPPLQT